MINQTEEILAQKKKRRVLRISLILLLLILLPLCVVATYTWISISKTPKVSDMEMTINADPGLELAWSPDASEEDWSQNLDFTDAVGTDTYLTPVTWSEREESFFTVRFGTDGRMVDAGTRLSDEKDANGNDGHYVKFTLYGRTTESINVFLSPAVVHENMTSGAGTYLIGTPLWQQDKLQHEDGGGGAQYAVRLGLRITKIKSDQTESDPVFFIYEPNSDKHVKKADGYIQTPSIDGVQNLISEDRLIRQTTTLWTENDPVERGVLIRQPGVFEENPLLFDLEEGEIVKIEVYLWLEGMDIDCLNTLGSGAKILSNLQFKPEIKGSGGLVPVEP